MVVFGAAGTCVFARDAVVGLVGLSSAAPAVCDDGVCCALVGAAVAEIDPAWPVGEAPVGGVPPVGGVVVVEVTVAIVPEVAVATAAAVSASGAVAVPAVPVTVLVVLATVVVAADVAPLTGAVAVVAVRVVLATVCETGCVAVPAVFVTVFVVLATVVVAADVALLTGAVAVVEVAVVTVDAAASVVVGTLGVVGSSARATPAKTAAQISAARTTEHRSNLPTPAFFLLSSDSQTVLRPKSPHFAATC